jgi:DNA-binding TFAR19-related protein (PDSD5 family)
MKFSEDDIDFLSLSDEKFEEMCFELLLQIGYERLIWRQGGADNGRDIEGYLETSNPLVGKITEKWFFECKRYEKGLPPEKIDSKIAWANAEQPQHLTIIISSYLTNNARTWLEKIELGKPYSVHIIEGKQLKQLLLNYPATISSYFRNQYEKLLLDIQHNWLILGIEPDLNSIAPLIKHLDLSKLSENELGFLWNFAHVIMGVIDEEQFLEREAVSLGAIYHELTAVSNFTESVLSEEIDFSTVQFKVGNNIWETDDVFYVTAKLIIDPNLKRIPAIYTFVCYEEEGLEVLVTATSDFLARIRHMKTNASIEMQKSNHKLMSKTRSKSQ